MPEPAAPVRKPAPPPDDPCPECGGRCLDEEAELTKKDWMWLGNRLARMNAARPAGAKEPHRFCGFGMGEVEAEQLVAFEAGVERWWLVVPPADGDDAAEWRYADDG